MLGPWSLWGHREDALHAGTCHPCGATPAYLAAGAALEKDSEKVYTWLPRQQRNQVFSNHFACYFGILHAPPITERLSKWHLVALCPAQVRVRVPLVKVVPNNLLCTWVLRQLCSPPRALLPRDHREEWSSPFVCSLLFIKIETQLVRQSPANPTPGYFRHFPRLITLNANKVLCWPRGAEPASAEVNGTTSTT